MIESAVLALSALMLAAMSVAAAVCVWRACREHEAWLADWRDREQG